MELIDFFELKRTEIKETKIHFATGEKNNREAFDEFIKGTFKEWQEKQTKKNFPRKFILALIYLSPGEWLFGGIYRVISFEETNKKKEKIKYFTELTDKGKEFLGRLIIDFKKGFRISYANCENHIEKFSLVEIKRKKYSIRDFPGYENLNISFDGLKLILKMEDKGWKSALSSVQGVYLISDKENGKLYVGSACGEQNFWQRWSDYSKSFHGNNKELKEIIKKKGKDYSENFSFSILEVYKNTTDPIEIIEREKYWKKVLLTREFGYNKN